MAQAAAELEEGLHDRIVGQGESIQQILNLYRTYLARMQAPGRPVGNFLFLGSPGTGKTRVVEATAETLIGDARAVIKSSFVLFGEIEKVSEAL